jgi:hypothetical protein
METFPPKLQTQIEGKSLRCTRGTAAIQLANLSSCVAINPALPWLQRERRTRSLSSTSSSQLLHPRGLLGHQNEMTFSTRSYWFVQNGNTWYVPIHRTESGLAEAEGQYSLPFLDTLNASV